MYSRLAYIGVGNPYCPTNPPPNSPPPCLLHMVYTTISVQVRHRQGFKGLGYKIFFISRFMFLRKLVKFML